MDAKDYLIDHSEIDWISILSSWHWFLPTKFTVWLMNRFGDLFLILDEFISSTLEAERWSE